MQMLNQLLELLTDSGLFYTDWKMIVMWVVVGVLFYLAVKHQFEPLLLIPIAFGALLANLPTFGVVNKPAGPILSPETGIVEYIFTSEQENLSTSRVVKDQYDTLWRIFSDEKVRENTAEAKNAKFAEFETKVKEYLAKIERETAPKVKEEGKADLSYKGTGTPKLLAIVRPDKPMEGEREWMNKSCQVEFQGRKLTIMPNDKLIWLNAGGTVDKINFKEGDKVAKNQTIIELTNTHAGGLYHYISMGVLLELFPPIIFLGVGALTDFGPLIANPKTLLLGGAAQFGVLATLLCAIAIGFSAPEAASIGIIGGADGPTSIFTSNKLAPHLMAPIAVAAYSYMALVPVIQPPIMRALTTEAERKIKMTSLRKVSKLEKLIFCVFVTIFVIMLVPDCSALIGMLMFGNFIKESGVCERLSKCAQNELINIVTIFLGSSVGLTMTADRFLNSKTLFILGLGVVAFAISTAAGILMAKTMNLFLKDKINPLIGSAGVSAVPMAARVSHVEGQKADPSNFLLMHAMGPNVAGVIGTAVVAGYFISTLKGL